jgi:hypothetical protein
MNIYYMQENFEKNYHASYFFISGTYQEVYNC